MGASTSSSSSSAAAAAAATSSSFSTDKQFRRGKLACRFLMISNCALAVYIITRPRKKERSKGGSGSGGVEEGVRDVGQQQQLVVVGDGERVEAEGGRLLLMGRRYIELMKLYYSVRIHPSCERHHLNAQSYKRWFIPSIFHLWLLHR